MVKYWHISLLVLIALIWKVRPTSASMDVCDMGTPNASMYCTCEPLQRNDIEITCYVFGPITPNNVVWDSFRRHENTVAFTIRPRSPNQLEFIPVRALQSLQSLVSLTIQEAYIEVLPAASVSDLPKLFNLNLMRNGIVTMERYAIWNLPKLKKLSLSENFIIEILADTFSELGELEELYLDRNNISRLEGCAFCNLHNLKEMELWKNNIEDIDERTFRGLRYLHRLDLFNNQLKTLRRRVFSSMPKLRELDLKNNVIHHISPHAFDGLNELAILKISNNRIKVLPEHVFQPLPKLMQLDLSLNKIETIDEEVVENIHNAMGNHFMFAFKSNPFVCGCEWAWLPRWVHKVKSPRFGHELRHVECVDDDGEKLVISDLMMKACEEPKKRSKNAKMTPHVSLTEGSSTNSNELTSLHPKYDSEYSDGTANRTLYAHPVTVQPVAEPNNAGNVPIPTNTVLLCYISAFALLLMWP